VDFAGFSGKTLHGAIAEPLDKIRAGRLRPESLRVRLLVPDTSAPWTLLPPSTACTTTPRSAPARPASWNGTREGEWDDEAMMRAYLGDLLNNLRKNRDVLTGLVASSKEVDTDVLVTLTAAVDEMFARIGLMSELEAHRRQWFSPEGIDSVLRMLVAMVLGLVTYDWLLVKPGNNHSDQLLDTMVPLALWGRARHPPAAVSAGSSSDVSRQTGSTSTLDHDNCHQDKG
jgi:hypothetical protein